MAINQNLPRQKRSRNTVFYAAYRAFIQRSPTPLFDYVESKWGVVKKAPGLLLLSFVLGGAIGWTAAHYRRNRENELSENFKMLIKTDYENEFSEALRHPRAKFELANLAQKAFEAGDYAYSALSFSNSFRIDSDGEMKSMCLPLYYAAVFSQNPTSDGRNKFHQDLESILQDVEKANQTNTDSGLYGYYRQAGYLESLHASICLVGAYPNPIQSESMSKMWRTRFSCSEII